jgi:4-hydroxy-tetrahydrodipicolinate synthase
MAVGAEGVISVVSNILPREISRMVQLFQDQQVVAARKIHDKYYQLFRDLFIETNPLPIKAAMAMKGMVLEEYRLPLVPMSAKNREILKNTLVNTGVLKA